MWCHSHYVFKLKSAVFILVLKRVSNFKFTISTKPITNNGLLFKYRVVPNMPIINKNLFINDTLQASCNAYRSKLVFIVFLKIYVNTCTTIAQINLILSHDN